MPSSRRIMVETSSIAGTFFSRTSSSVSRQAARMGRTAFLEPLIGTRPTNRVPPSIRSWATDPLGYQPSYAAGAIWSLRNLGSAAAAQLGQSQPRLGARQGDRGRGLVRVRQLLLQEVRRPAPGFLGTGFVDVLRPLRGIGEHGDLVGPHFQEPAGDKEELLLVLVAHLYHPRLEGRQQRDVPRQDAQLPLRAWRHDKVGIAFEAPAFDGHDVDVQLVVGQGVPSASRVRPLWLSPAAAFSPPASSRPDGAPHLWRPLPPRRWCPPCRRPAPAGRRAYPRGSR